MTSWPALLSGRESGVVKSLPPLATPNSGVLILDDSTVRKAAPTLLNHIEEPVHYVDLGGIKGHSLSQFGGSDTFWAGVKKLYASNCGLESIDGLKKLTNISYLYLDNNQLSDKELMRLCTEIPRGTLKGLDITGNPGLTEEVFGAFLDSGILKNCEFFNGERLRDTGFVG